MPNTISKSFSLFVTGLKLVFCLTLILILYPNELLGQKSLPAPLVDSISITIDDHPQITWFRNTDNDTKGYAIYQKQGAIWSPNPVGVVSGVQSTSFIHNDGSPCTNVETYIVVAVNYGNVPPFSPWSDELKTIFLDIPQHDLCSNTISLNWTEYINMVDDLGGYEVLASADGSDFSVIGSTDPGITAFIHTNPLPNTQYSYKIRAFNEDGTRTSTSCAVTIYSRTYPRPEFTNIITATVQDNSFIHLDWEADTLAPILRFDIERRAANENTFTIVQSFEDDAGYEPQTLTDDLTADFNAWSYEYRVVMWDSCDQNPRYSQITRTVHLSGEPLPDYTNRLQWNHYDGWNSGVARYNIYRSTDGMFVQIDDVPGSVNEYSDDISAFSGTGGVFNYYVEAVENGGNNALSKSNQITLETETRVEAPNAFIPGALPPDDEFKPTVNFIAVGSYELMIFNKWGEMIFITRDTEEGWDGRQNGELLPPGAYVYLIKYRTPEGKNMEKRGTVTIIR